MKRLSCMVYASKSLTCRVYKSEKDCHARYIYIKFKGIYQPENLYLMFSYKFGLQGALI